MCSQHRKVKDCLGVAQESNKFKRAWIWFWFNNWTRILCMIGIPLLPLVCVVGTIFGWGEYLKGVALITYSALMAWMFLDNDYSNLRRIGMNEHRENITNNNPTGRE